MTGIARRAVLALPAAALAPAGAGAQMGMGEGSAPALAPGEASFEETERRILAGRTPLPAGIVLDIPTLSENGNSVDVSVRVDSPWTAADRVTAIHLLAERNPAPRVATFHLSPRAGRAEVATRIRLATTQTVVALAETSTGRVHRATKEVIVILGACVDGG